MVKRSGSGELERRTFRTVARVQKARVHPADPRLPYFESNDVIGCGFKYNRLSHFEDVNEGFIGA